MNHTVNYSGFTDMFFDADSKNGGRVSRSKGSSPAAANPANPGERDARRHARRRDQGRLPTGPR